MFKKILADCMNQDQERQAEKLLNHGKHAGSTIMKVAIGAQIDQYRDKDRAFEWLNRAFDERDILIRFAKVLPTFDVARADPRFQTLVARLKIPV